MHDMKPKFAKETGLSVRVAVVCLWFLASLVCLCVVLRALRVAWCVVHASRVCDTRWPLLLCQRIPVNNRKNNLSEGLCNYTHEQNFTVGPEIRRKCKTVQKKTKKANMHLRRGWSG
jgi:hypothetical protein